MLISLNDLLRNPRLLDSLRMCPLDQVERRVYEAITGEPHPDSVKYLPDPADGNFGLRGTLRGRGCAEL